MDDPRAAEGVEHLQRAARELLQAARSFLDVVEDVVEDPERLGGAAAGLVDVVRSGLGRQDAPWVAAAWDSPWPDDDVDDGDGADADVTDGAAAATDLDVPDAADAPDGDGEPVEPVVAEEPATRTGTQRTGTSRVRRISVD